MNVQLGRENVRLPEDALIGLPPRGFVPGHFAEVVAEAVDRPVDGLPLEQQQLAGKKVAVMVDDWGRPTPASEFLPVVLERLRRAGASREDITIVTASGMHDPMSDSELERKVGTEVFRSYRCISHEAGNRSLNRFLGITPSGNPVWVNRYVAEADYKVAVGRCFPHNVYGYEGGYKMIVPGVASFETIIRDHSLNFSPNSDYGILKPNPSRNEANNIGQYVGIDFDVNMVMTYQSEPVRAFAGSVEASFAAAVSYGQRNVWGYSLGGEKADVTILCAKEESDLSLSNNPMFYLGVALSATKPDGVVISTMEYQSEERAMLYGHDLLHIPMDELILLHEKRNWAMDDRAIQKAIKLVRQYFFKRRIFEMRSQQIYIVSNSFPYERLERWRARQFSTIQEALDCALAQKPNARVLALPEATTTLPLTQFDD